MIFIYEVFVKYKYEKLVGFVKWLTPDLASLPEIRYSLQWLRVAADRKCHSDIHPIDSGPSKDGSVGNAETEGAFRDVAHSAFVDGHAESERTTIYGAGVKTVHDGQSGHLPIAPLLCEAIVCPQCVVCHALLAVAVVEVVALGPVESVHN